MLFKEQTQIQIANGKDIPMEVDTGSAVSDFISHQLQGADVPTE